MDAFSDLNTEIVVVMSASQVGKTEILNNIVGYHIDHDPSPILAVQATLEIAKAWSKDRLAPMLRDTPCLQGKVKDVRSRDADNTTLHKKFPGGHITIAGANSPASLASRPIRIVLCDEVDRYPASAGTEGDPVDLAFKRATTFWNRKLALFSTPTIKGMSRIEKAYEQSDKRKFYVPCPHCEEYQILKWSQVQWPEGRPQDAVYICEHCGNEITDADKVRMLRYGEWRAEREFRGLAGFWLNELYSPWVSFGNMAVRFVEAKRRGKEALKVFVNTALAETWEDEGESIDETGLLARRENYGPEIPIVTEEIIFPKKVHKDEIKRYLKQNRLEKLTIKEFIFDKKDPDFILGFVRDKSPIVLTCGVDVQKDYLIAEVVAWGDFRESWGIEFVEFYGDPKKPDVWNDLDQFLQKTYKHESGVEIPISCTCIDTGAFTQHVYDFVKPRQGRRIYGIKGSSQKGLPIVNRPKKKNKGGILLFSLGVDTAKGDMYGYIKIEEPGPGYMHFPLYYPKEYFEQLTAERMVTRYKKGFVERDWVKPAGARNEALDCRVYALAAFYILGLTDKRMKMSREKILQQGIILNTTKPSRVKKRRIISRGIE